MDDTSVKNSPKAGKDDGDGKHDWRSALRAPIAAPIIAAIAAVALVLAGAFGAGWAANGAQSARQVDAVSKQLADRDKRLKELKTKYGEVLDERGSLQTSNDELSAKNDDLTRKNNDLTAKNKELDAANKKLKADAAAAGGGLSKAGGLLIAVEGYSEREEYGPDSHELHMTVRNYTAGTFSMISIGYELRDASGKTVGTKRYAFNAPDTSVGPGQSIDIYDILYNVTNWSGLTVVPLDWNASAQSDNGPYINGHYDAKVKTYVLQ
ncbi:hypothetical protein KIH79_03355 [Bifidobacterium sp. 82T10]|uniref:Uncharacterized protein n=1 Tax=Bifidobacterium miconis TaxID=2834435 RepID=A0ABS6WE56_9BIFI|nr:hypothetical protein [Bifidobacterium miconis]MBW3092005.1 hypothetical protein [Bifidobacterium miconis]